MYWIKNAIAFGWWAVTVWLFFNDAAFFVCLTAVLLSAAPFYKFIIHEPNNQQVPPLSGLTRYTLLTSVTALSVVKASQYAGGKKGQSQDHTKVLVREDGHE